MILLDALKPRPHLTTAEGSGIILVDELEMILLDDLDMLLLDELEPLPHLTTRRAGG